MKRLDVDDIQASTTAPQPGRRIGTLRGTYRDSDPLPTARAVTKTLISIRIDHKVLARYRASGPGWQSRINELLTTHAPRARRKRTR